MKTKILIIEDNKDVQENLAELLSLIGYEVFTADNGKMGANKAIEVIPDIIICDVMMPEMDGFGVLRILSNRPDTMDIPFIFLTAKTEKDDFRKGMGLGADDYITKPYDDILLLDTVKMRLDKSRRLRTGFDKTSQGLLNFIDEVKGQNEFDQLATNREIRKYNKRDKIYDAGQYPKWLYFVASGSVKSYQTNDGGKEITVHLYSSGDFFGHIALLSGETYHDSVSVIDDCELCLIPKDDFTKLLFNHREFSATFIKMLANQSEAMEKKLLDLAYSSVRKKVANALLKFKDKKQSNIMSIMREDLASMAGTTKETTIRTLSDFKNEGLISIDDNRITILKEDKLIHMQQ